ncbi:unnamed protein product, partial [Allacma fusca]
MESKAVFSRIPSGGGNNGALDSSSSEDSSY